MVRFQASNLALFFCGSGVLAARWSLVRLWLDVIVCCSVSRSVGTHVIKGHNSAPVDHQRGSLIRRLQQHCFNGVHRLHKCAQSSMKRITNTTRSGSNGKGNDHMDGTRSPPSKFDKIQRRDTLKCERCIIGCCLINACIFKSV